MHSAETLRGPPSSVRTLGREPDGGWKVRLEKGDQPCPPEAQESHPSPTWATAGSVLLLCPERGLLCWAGRLYPVLLSLTVEDQAEPQWRPHPVWTSCTGRLECQARLISFFLDFPSSLVRQRPSTRAPGRAETLQLCGLLQSQVGLCWVLRLHYREPALSSPVSAARAALGRRRASPPSYKPWA